MKIGITKAHFFAFHGYFEEERIHGHSFNITLEVEIPDEKYEAENLGSSIDYGALFQICKDQMNTPRLLLETVGFSILADIRSKWEVIIHAKIRIEKIGPQLGGSLASSYVEMEF